MIKNKRIKNKTINVVFPKVISIVMSDCRNNYSNKIYLHNYKIINYT